MMLPIETVYRGYRFRSRLEARWAVFFDALKIRWEYEPEGFELGNGERYLPDFFLPRLNDRDGTYAEVKPFHSDQGWRKAIRFGRMSQRPVLLLDGPPDLRSYLMFDTHIQGVASIFFYDKYLPGGSHGNEYRLYWEGKSEIEYLDAEGGYYNIVIKAIHAARAAPFEFGAPLARAV